MMILFLLANPGAQTYCVYTFQLTTIIPERAGCHDVSFLLTEGEHCCHQQQPRSLLIPTLWSLHRTGCTPTLHQPTSPSTPTWGASGWSSLQQAEELPVALIAFPFWYHAVQLVNQLGLHLEGSRDFVNLKWAQGKDAKSSPLWWGRTLGNCFLLLFSYQRNPGEGGISPTAPGSHAAFPHQEGLPL